MLVVEAEQTEDSGRELDDFFVVPFTVVLYCRLTLFDVKAMRANAVSESSTLNDKVSLPVALCILKSLAVYLLQRSTLVTHLAYSSPALLTTTALSI